jgi:4-diphosphocytidyl-2-C-methyl-D-erythritol kinase
VTLQKRIPVAAGLAGGSTDCAGVLMGINRMCRLGLSLSELERLGAELGSDVPFCLGGPTAWATGRGEQMKALPACPPLFFVLVKPAYGIATPKVYGNLRLDLIKRHPDVQQCMDGLAKGDTMQILQGMGNLLEHSTFRLQPNVEKLKRSMIEYGCEHVLMSGSGPTVFAAFAQRQEAQAYYQKVKGQYPEAILTRTVNKRMLEERVELYGNESSR